MSGLLWRLTRTETIEALVMGTLAAQARSHRTAYGPAPARPHPMADLTGQPVEVIVDAVFAAMSAAHQDDWAREPPDVDAYCASCSALIELASRYGDTTGMAWPDPVRRHMAEVLDEWLAGQNS